MTTPHDSRPHTQVTHSGSSAVLHMDGRVTIRRRVPPGERCSVPSTYPGLTWAARELADDKDAGGSLDTECPALGRLLAAYDLDDIGGGPTDG